MKKLRIGYLSTAGIGKKNWKAIHSSGNCVISAVASRDVEKSRAYIRECQAEAAFDVLPEALGSYHDLLKSPNVDAIYLPLPTGLRGDYVIRAAAAGKHVICEKPCANNVDELEQMLHSCERHKVQFMDGVMFMHSPRLARVREILDDEKSIGRVRRITSAFSFYPGKAFFDTNIRANGALEPTGCLGDLGWYCIRFALWTMKWQMPRSVTGRLLNQSKSLPDRPSAPTEFAGGMLFDDDVSMEFFSSFLAAKQQWTHVSGQNGWLLLPDFIHPYNSYEPAFEVNEKIIRLAGTPCPPGVDPAEQGHPTAQDTRMFRNFADQVFSGKLNHDWPMWALRTQQVLDACFAAGRTGQSVKLQA
jgi:predicted dehydrogenase